MKAIIKGKEYRIRTCDVSDTTGPRDPGITNDFTVYRDEFDNIGYGALNDLGKNFGWRLILKGNKGQQEVTELTKDDVVIVRDNA